MAVKFGLMKFLDRWVGTPLCLALTAFRFLITPLRLLRRRPAEPGRIALIKFFGMGSLLQAVPMLKAIRRRHPGARLLIVTFEENRRLLERTGLLDVVISVSPRRLLTFPYQAIRALARLLAWHPDVVIDMEYFSRFSVLMAYLTFAPIRVGFWLPQVWRGALLTHKVYYNHFKHISEVFLALAGAIGVEPQRAEPPSVEPPADASESARRLLAREGINPAAGYVAINPNASPLCLERRWPAASFAELIDLLIERGERVVLVGSGSERPYTEYVRSLARRGASALNVAGRTSLDEAMAIVGRARLVVSNDSGILHLAAAAGAPVVALFGPEHPDHYGPLGSRRRVFYKGVYCSPCLNAYNSKTAPCNGNNICMKQITVEEVFEAAVEELRRPAPGFPRPQTASYNVPP